MTLNGDYTLCFKSVFRSPQRKFEWRYRPILSEYEYVCPMIVSGNIRLTQIFAAGVPWRRGVIRQWGYRKRRFSGLSDAMSSAPNSEMRPSLYSLVKRDLASFSEDIASVLSLFHWLQNTQPWMTLNGHLMLIFHYYEHRLQHLGYILIVEQEP